MINPRVWRGLFMNLYKLKSFDFGRNTSTLSEFIGYAELTDCREIPPEHCRDSDKPKGVGKF